MSKAGNGQFLVDEFFNFPADTVSFRKKKATAEYTILAGEMKQIEEIIFTDKYSYTDNNLKEDSEVIRKKFKDIIIRS
ncbi:hypothetical protein LJC62_04130 [Odoribacter sp. OttesenSCG-928-A06]|nr:hypothetical protein [Odoribacter sp. OttesenSCG-928-A06]